MAAAWLWARADIRRRWSSLVLLAAVVALATGAVLALVAGARRAGSAVDNYLDAAGTAEVVMFTESDPAPDLLASLADDPRIERIERSVTAPIAPSPAQPGENAYMFVGLDGPLAPHPLDPPTALRQTHVAQAASEEAALSGARERRRAPRGDDRRCRHRRLRRRPSRRARGASRAGPAA